MRFPSAARLAAVVACACAGLALASPESIRADVASRLQAAIPEVPVADYARGPAAFDPDLRAAVEAHKDEAAPLLERGAARWKRKFRDGRTLAQCFPNGGRRVAASYPLYDPRLKRVVTLEMAINQCLKVHKEPLIEGSDSPEMAQIAAYLRSLAEGARVAVRVPAAAEPILEEGRRLYFTRMGELNFACASCHIQGAGKRYADMPLAAAIGPAARWPFVRDGKAITLQAQMRECLERMGAAPFAAGSDELNGLEYFLTYLANGLAIRPNTWRPSRP